MNHFTPTLPTRQPEFRQPANYPATVEEAEKLYQRFPALRFHHGRPCIPIGEAIRRAIDKEPDPLPESFFRRLAVAIREDPEEYGRLLHYALATQEGHRV